METLTSDFDADELSLPPIAGGDDEGEGDEVATGDSPAGDEAGGDDNAEGDAQEGAEGDEEQQQGDQQQQFDANGQPIGPGAGYGAEGAPGGAGGPGPVPYSRFKEINDRLVARDREFSTLLQRFGQGGPVDGQNGRQAAPEVPEQYRELDKGMGGYMRHYLDPVAQHIMGMQQRYDQQIADFRDESKFYRGSGRGLNDTQIDLVEQTREALSQKLRQPVERADALLFLRGHPQHGKLFVDQRATQQRTLENGVVAARRGAGKVGARGTVTRGRGDTDNVDLNKLPRAERIRVFERSMGNTPV